MTSLEHSCTRGRLTRRLRCCTPSLPHLLAHSLLSTVSICAVFILIFVAAGKPTRRKCDLDDDSQTLVGVIRSAGYRLLMVINDILDYSALTTAAATTSGGGGPFHLNKQPFDAHELARDATAMFATQAAAKGVAFRCDVSKLRMRGSNSNNAGKSSATDVHDA